ncbi:MAG: DNA repair protein RecO [Corynebacteriales bacterium]|nr:DNA repair protein RecO [Mycobacteriales bacterium]
MGKGAGQYGARGLYRDHAIVLRLHKLGEADRIITVLTKRHGKIRAVAKGVRKTSSRFGARLEPFSHIDVQLYLGRSLDVVSQVETLTHFGKNIMSDYAGYTAASVIAETAERLVDEEREPALRLYLLTVGALRSIAAGEHDPPLILDAYLLRAMATAGWEPALQACAVCGRDGAHRAFSVASGGCVCTGCRPPGSATPAPETLELMSALLHGSWNYADASVEKIRREASGLIAAHLQWHLERGLRSLPFVERP